MAKTWFAPEETAAFEFAQQWQREHASTFPALVAQLEPVNVGGKVKECQIPFILMGKDKLPYRLVVFLKKFGRRWQATQTQVLDQKGGLIMAEEVNHLFLVHRQYPGDSMRHALYLAVGDEIRHFWGEPVDGKLFVERALAQPSGKWGYSDSTSAGGAEEVNHKEDRIQDLLEAACKFHGVRLEELNENMTALRILSYTDDSGDFGCISVNHAADFVVESVRENKAVGETGVEIKTAMDKPNQHARTVVLELPQGELSADTETEIRDAIAESIQNWMPEWRAGIAVFGHKTSFRMGLSL